MGFGREARRVGDVGLPVGHRFGALRSCITHAQPIGYHATWTYLEATTGIHHRDPGFLLPALDLLLTERSTHLRLCDDYAVLRRAQKAAGLRLPPRDAVTPREPHRWHGDERSGAVHALRSWRTRPVDDDLSAIVAALLDDPVGFAPDAAMLQDSLARARRQVHAADGQTDLAAYHLAWWTLRVLGQVHLVLHGATAVGEPWHFLGS